jgi:integrase
LLLANEPTKVVSERLGHASAQVTEAIYQHVLPSMQERAAEKMNRLLAQALHPKPLAEVATGA